MGLSPPKVHIGSIYEKFRLELAQPHPLHPRNADLKGRLDRFLNIRRSPSLAIGLAFEIIHYPFERVPYQVCWVGTFRRGNDKAVQMRLENPTLEVSF